MPSARRAGPGDLALVEAITASAYAEYAVVLDRVPFPVTEDYAPRIAAGEVWLVSQDGVDLGALVLETAADHILIFSIAVLPAAKGAGAISQRGAQS